MNYFLVKYLFFTVYFCQKISSHEYQVDSAEKLRKILESVQPGDNIIINKGFDASGGFTINRNGTQEMPITLLGEKHVQLNTKESGIFRLNASNWVIRDLHLSSDLTESENIGIDVEGNFNTFSGLKIQGFHYGISLDKSSSKNLINHNTFILREDSCAVDICGRVNLLGGNHLCSGNNISENVFKISDFWDNAIILGSSSCCGSIEKNFFSGGADNEHKILVAIEGHSYQVRDNEVNFGVRHAFVIDNKGQGIAFERNKMSSNKNPDSVCIFLTDPIINDYCDRIGNSCVGGKMSNFQSKCSRSKYYETEDMSNNVTNVLNGLLFIHVAVIVYIGFKFN